jgi:hypothetical protein
MQRQRLMFLTGSVCSTPPSPPTVVASVKSLYPRCAGQLQSLESATLDVDISEESILHTHFAVLLSFILISRQALINIYSINLSTSCHIIFYFFGDISLHGVLLLSQQPQQTRPS